MEKGWGIPRGESIPLWARQRDSCPPVSPCALWYPVPAMGSVWHKGTLLAPQPPRPRPGPVLWPGQECPWGTALSSQPSCAHLGVLHPFPHPQWGAPSWLGLEMGHLWALCTLGSFKSQLAGGFLSLSPFTGEPETPLLSSALLLLPQLSRPFLCLPKDTALGLLAAPWDFGEPHRGP